MPTLQDVVASAPEVFLFLAIAIGTVLGRVRIGGFAIGATACTLIVAVVLGQLGTFVIPSLLKSILFGLFVFTIGYRSGPGAGSSRAGWGHQAPGVTDLQ